MYNKIVFLQLKKLNNLKIFEKMNIYYKNVKIY